MNDMWRLIVGIILVFLSGSAAVKFAYARVLWRSAVWFIGGAGMGTAGILLILLPAVARGG